eukprot:CAMPEP_0118673292 /NCGR_PEP_ID=MMETSP0800-20121206/238_1 /TAXON_ID=210618 ORGANISM="Striatella unipunctata, Strain CCMP2910" /NCGR_SAMPLE_ID=MMETSP0800 /ASSEMBLY_ACC=CAM_ASM_000638 /LENGTH=69 /DNA_ID=CAMNT_0006568333 /DNA_START=246 /DNA_END=455 /DNA_ORIENTATION=-
MMKVNMLVQCCCMLHSLLMYNNIPNDLFKTGDENELTSEGNEDVIELVPTYNSETEETTRDQLLQLMVD